MLSVVHVIGKTSRRAAGIEESDAQRTVTDRRARRIVSVAQHMPVPNNPEAWSVNALRTRQTHKTAN